MLAKALRKEAAAFLGFVCVALVFAWPLPLHLADALFGRPSGDAGVYVWNLWVFRHEIVTNHHLPFLTSEILALNTRVPLALHNYTTFANILAFPLIPLLGIVRTFNLLVIGTGAGSAYAMYLYARSHTEDRASAWVAGLLFGFSPFMSARAGEHFSLTLAAPLPIFGLLLHRLYLRPTLGLSCAAGATVAWAFLCDVYYAVYCLLIALFMACYTMLDVERRPATVQRAWPRVLIDLLIFSVAGLVAGILVRGGGSAELFGLRISMTRLYTPVLVLTILVGIRVWMALRPRIIPHWPALGHASMVGAACIVCAAVLTPVLVGAVSNFRQGSWISPQIWWRSSAPGADLLALFAPNPLHPLVSARVAGWIASLPNGFHENVASMSWIALGTILLAVGWAQFRPPRGWVVFTAVFAWLALGPFVTIAGYNTYVPTPWALLRYLPIVGAARMPPRLVIVVTMGVAMLLALALQHLRARTRHPRVVTVTVAALLLFELLPAPRVLYSAEIPAVYHTIAADPRPVRVLNLPFGLRDGLSARGNYSSSSQFYQTFHEKGLVGGYVSRLPGDSMVLYRRNGTLRLLMRMSEGAPIDDAMYETARANASETMQRLRVGYVVVDSTRTTPALLEFAKEAFSMTLVQTEDALELYRTPIAPPLQPSARAPEE